MIRKLQDRIRAREYKICDLLYPGNNDPMDLNFTGIVMYQKRAISVIKHGKIHNPHGEALIMQKRYWLDGREIWDVEQ